MSMIDQIYMNCLFQINEIHYLTKSERKIVEYSYTIFQDFSFILLMRVKEK